MSAQNFDLIIIGAGAAGLMCAMTAAARGKSVALLDHNDQVGAKILISGGGRCNFTNTGTTAQNFLSQNPHFCRSALSRYTPDDFIDLLAKHNIAWHEKTLGQLFCDGSAKQIVAMLKSECEAVGVKILVSTQITDIQKADHFTVDTSRGRFTAQALVMATGGLSIPKMGATGFSYDIAKKFGLKVVTPVPGLVPLRAKPQEAQFCIDLAGVAVRSIVRAGKSTFIENALFTHRGLSGPAILQISSYLQRGEAITLDFLAGQNPEEHFKQKKHERPKAELRTILGELMPQRLANALAPDTTMEKLTPATLAAMINQLQNWTMTPAETEGFAKAEVTVGGVDTTELSSKTMAAKSVPGLYFIGEAVDVTGWLGGYNFQWAWASGFVAGCAT
jgi:predicted Rossmann fold flavoprotein